MSSSSNSIEVKFTIKEAAALSQYCDLMLSEKPWILDEGDEILTAIEKIDNALNERIKSKNTEAIEAVYNAPPWITHPISTKIRRRVKDAIRKNTALKISYYSPSSGELSERIIEPIELEESRYGYLKAFCHLRKDERKFRLDRIIEAEKISKKLQQTLNTNLTTFKLNKMKKSLIWLSLAVSFLGSSSFAFAQSGMVDSLSDIISSLGFLMGVFVGIPIMLNSLKVFSKDSSAGPMDFLSKDFLKYFLPILAVAVGIGAFMGVDVNQVFVSQFLAGLMLFVLLGFGLSLLSSARKGMEKGTELRVKDWAKGSAEDDDEDDYDDEDETGARVRSFIRELKKQKEKVDKLVKKLETAVKKLEKEGDDDNKRELKKEVNDLKTAVKLEIVTLKDMEDGAGDIIKDNSSIKKVKKGIEKVEDKLKKIEKKLNKINK